MIHLYCGDGKGKTTASVGLAVRACGSGLSVCFAQFMKGQRTGEIDILSGIPGITVIRPDFSTKFTYQMTEDERQAEHEKNHQLLEDIIRLSAEGLYDLVILDEAVTAVGKDLLDQNRFRYLVSMYGSDGCAAGKELAVTGAVPEAWMIESADYVTDMEKIKHPFDRGIKARKGIEY